MTVYVISKLWTDSSENRYDSAVGYSTVGYVNTKEDADEIVDAGGNVVGDGWPFERGEIVARYKYTKVEAM